MSRIQASKRAGNKASKHSGWQASKLTGTQAKKLAGGKRASWSNYRIKNEKNKAEAV